MKLKETKTLRLLFSIIVVTTFASCGKKSGSGNTSTATGWNINDKKGGFQYATDYKKQVTGPGLIAIEGGTFTMGRVQDDIMHDWNNTPNQQHVQSFYMDESEVTNKMYLEYLDYLKRMFPPDQDNYKNIYHGAVPDTLVWRDRLGYNETMTLNYLRHPAYAEYPVVGVNWIQAVEFSKWRTDRVNELLLEQSGYLKRDARYEATGEKSFSTETYLNAPTLTYGGDEELVLKGKRGRASKDSINLYANRSSGATLPEYRLPTEAEWEYAAAANVGNREYNLYKGQKKYPWSGSYTRAGNRAIRGDQMANFKQGKGDYGGIAGWSDDGADITAPVKSYAPNDFGLYDMAGNVNEWVADVYRPIVDDEANDFNYFRGNVYTKNKIGDDGKVVLITTENIVYDTLANGRIIARNFPGQIAQIPVDEQETYLRQNFDRSDNRNYRDGDRQSTRHFKVGAEDEDNTQNDKFRMYNSPQHKVSVNEESQMVRQFDKSSKRTSLIDDDVRVYKGGSWRDRAYWLDPAQRRYLPQDMASDDIGFRCAMSKVGPKSNKKSARGKPKSSR
jgi:gliding motility-associated lipoprotein GldJ